MRGNIFTCTITRFIEYETLKLCQLRAQSNERLQVFGGSGRTQSKMGFRTPKPPSGCPVTIWDEKLLSQDYDINIHNLLQENELEEKVRKK
jgi:hypothetical protein